MTNQTAIDDKIHDYFMETIKAERTSLNYAAKNTYYAVTYYINTGRAYSDWIKAWYKASPKKLIAHVSKHGGTTEDDLQAITAYLKRYCGLKII